MSKAANKKMEMAKKMGKTDKTKAIVEGDYQHLGPQDNFSARDVKKEKSLRSKKYGRIPETSWEI